MSRRPYTYPGGELELFALATNWKRYWTSLVKPFVQGDVLEVGAGFGSNTPYLITERCRTWTALEPDATLAGRLDESLAAIATTVPRRAIIGTLGELTTGRFDAILYADVLEHIGDDGRELEYAARRLVTGGRLIVLAPAHRWLFTPFDTALGHHRRYSRTSLRRAAPASLMVEYAADLDAAGIVASLGNRLLLRSPLPSARQILVWDRLLVPVSRWLDPLIGRRLGKSVLVVWRKAAR